MNRSASVQPVEINTLCVGGYGWPETYGACSTAPTATPETPSPPKSATICPHPDGQATAATARVYRIKDRDLPGIHSRSRRHGSARSLTSEGWAWRFQQAARLDGKQLYACTIIPRKSLSFELLRMDPITRAAAVQGLLSPVGPSMSAMRAEHSPAAGVHFEGIISKSDAPLWVAFAADVQDADGCSPINLRPITTAHMLARQVRYMTKGARDKDVLRHSRQEWRDRALLNAQGRRNHPRAVILLGVPTRHEILARLEAERCALEHRARLDAARLDAERRAAARTGRQERVAAVVVRLGRRKATAPRQKPEGPTLPAYSWKPAQGHPVALVLSNSPP